MAIAYYVDPAYGPPQAHPSQVTPIPPQQQPHSQQIQNVLRPTIEIDQNNNHVLNDPNLDEGVQYFNGFDQQQVELSSSQRNNPTSNIQHQHSQSFLNFDIIIRLFSRFLSNSTSQSRNTINFENNNNNERRDNGNGTLPDLIQCHQNDPNARISFGLSIQSSRISSRSNTTTSSSSIVDSNNREDRSTVSLSSSFPSNTSGISRRRRHPAERQNPPIALLSPNQSYSTLPIPLQGNNDVDEEWTVELKIEGEIPPLIKIGRDLRQIADQFRFQVRVEGNIERRPSTSNTGNTSIRASIFLTLSNVPSFTVIAVAATTVIGIGYWLGGFRRFL